MLGRRTRVCYGFNNGVKKAPGNEMRNLTHIKCGRHLAVF